MNIEAYKEYIDKINKCENHLDLHNIHLEILKISKKDQMLEIALLFPLKVRLEELDKTIG